MTLKKIALPAIVLMTLTACMDGGGASVSKAPTGLSNCAHLAGISAQYIQGDNVRCGPQAELPYTLR